MLKRCVVALSLLPLWAVAAPSASSSNWDQPMPVLARIDWSDPLNPALVPVGQDRFLFDTLAGVRLWDAKTAQFLPLNAGPAVPERLRYGAQNAASLGLGTVMVGLSRDQRQAALWGWSAATQALAPPLVLEGIGPTGWRVQGLDAQHVLACHPGNGAFVLRWSAGMPAPSRVAQGDAVARSALQGRGVVGSVTGFGALTLANARTPVLYDAQRCAWDLTQPPAELAPYLDRQRRGDRHPTIKPYFLSDGRVVVPEVEYFDAQKGFWRSIANPLLWDPNASAWQPLAALRSERASNHRSGQQEPVLAVGRGAALVETLHLPTLAWRRFNEQLPYANDWLLEPLSTGAVLVVNRATEAPLRGAVGRITPSDGSVPPGRMHYPRDTHYAAAVAPGRYVALIGVDGVRDSDAAEWLDVATAQSTELPRLPPGAHWPAWATAAALAEGGVLVLGGLPRDCAREDQFLPSGACADRVGLPSWRYRPGARQWEPVPALRIPYSRGPSWQWGNSYRTTLWPRVDVAVRASGELVWLQGGEFPESRERELWPRSTALMAWSPSAPHGAPRRVAELRKGRVSGSVVVLADGRLAVVGGDAQLDRVALTPRCTDCPDEFVSIGPMRPARSTEVLDETEPKAPRWVNGPLAHFPGGQGFRLDNGRLIKVSLREPMGENGVQAEAADAAFTQWARLPMPPAVPARKERAQADIRQVTAVGNRVLVLTDGDATLAWDDDAGNWRVHAGWPSAHEGSAPLSIAAAAQPGQVLVRYARTVRLLALPKN